MTAPFAWFDNIGSDRGATTDFLVKTFDWDANDIGPMTFLAKGKDMPFAAACDAMEGVSGWLPYIEVDDLPANVARAKANGAVIVAENMDGPAGIATYITDPGGASLALWKRAEGM